MVKTAVAIVGTGFLLAIGFWGARKLTDLVDQKLAAGDPMIKELLARAKRSNGVVEASAVVVDQKNEVKPF